MNPADAFAVLDLTDPPLWLVTARDGPRRGGLIASSVSRASIVPELPRVAVGLARQHHTWGLVEASGAFALHLLGEEHLDWVWRFGLRSGRDGDKLDGLAVQSAATGSPLLPDALGWLDCRVEARLDTGDRTLYLAEVLDARLIRDAPPLTARRLVERAPAERLRELKEQLARDAAVDAVALHAWRQERTTRP